MACGGLDAYVGCTAGVDARADAERAERDVEARVLEAVITRLADHGLVLVRLQDLVHQLGAPRPLTNGDVLEVAEDGREVREDRRLADDLLQIDHLDACGPRNPNRLVDAGQGTLHVRHVPPDLRDDVRERTVVMYEVVLHVDDDERRVIRMKNLLGPLENLLMLTCVRHGRLPLRSM